jgi:hypothetical protein
MIYIPNQIYRFHGETPQTKRDQLMVAREVVAIGPPFLIMAEKLGKYSKTQLVEMAAGLFAGSPKKKIGRLPRRYRAAMICWFCKNAAWMMNSGPPNPSAIHLPAPAQPDPQPADAGNQNPPFTLEASFDTEEFEAYPELGDYDITF